MNRLMILKFHIFLLLVITWVAPGLAAPSAESGKIAAGTEWETEFYVVDSGIAGPTVLIVGGVHGNEPAGYRAYA